MTRCTTPHFLLLAASLLTPRQAPAAQPVQTNTVPATQAATAGTNSIVAKAKGWEITRAQLDNDVAAALAQSEVRGRKVKADQISAVEWQVLEQLINVRLILARATEADKAAGKAAADKRYATARAHAGSEEDFDLQLKFLATTREKLLAKWTEALTANAVLKRELKIVISDQEARKFYDENQAQFDNPEKLRIRHILIATRDPQTGAELSANEKAERRQKAEAVLKRARAGENFAELALAFSNDAGSRGRGGDYIFARGQMTAEIETVAFSLKTNQISDLITTTNGYHIIKLTDKIMARKTPYADAADDIKDGLAQQAIDLQFQDYIGRLRAGAGVEILDEKLQPPDVNAMQTIPEPPRRPRTESKRPG